MANAEGNETENYTLITSLPRAAGFMFTILCLLGFSGYCIYRGICQDKEKRDMKNQTIAQEAQIRSDAAVMLEATVLEKSYQNVLAQVAEYKAEERRSGVASQSHAMAFSNETVKIEPRLALKLETEKGDIMALSVVDAGSIRVESLEMLIEKGTKIKFPPSNIYATRYDPRNENYEVEVYRYLDETDFTKGTKVGTKRADRIRILK